MPQETRRPLLDYTLGADELAWVRSVHEDLAALQRPVAGREGGLQPKEALREVLGRASHALPAPMDLSGPGPWRNGRTRHGRFVTAVFLRTVELHRHERSRTDQFPMYVIGEAEAFTIGEDGRPLLTPVTLGSHCHNAPGAPHAFVPKVGLPIGADWEIGFIAITPRNILEDTQPVSEAVRAAYRQAVGQEPPLEP